MKKKNWRKHHKWFGLAVCFFMLMFCVSGILLNHRSLIRDIDISRACLPSRYEYKDWNGGLLRGTTKVRDHVLLYGNNGIWITDSTGSIFDDFNEGLPEGADWRQIRNVVAEADADTITSHCDIPLFAASTVGLYRFGAHGKWHSLPINIEPGDKLSDIALQGDTLIALSRSFIYMSLPPYHTFERVQLPAPAGYKKQTTAFRTMWLLHSGELFGMAGQLAVDAIALLLILLCATGLLCWLLPKYIRRRHRGMKFFRSSFSLHDNVGKYTIILTLFVAITGWCLRPPVMIALATTKMPILPGTALDSDNPWHDKLRVMRYDNAACDWLLSTSAGFYSMHGLCLNADGQIDASKICIKKVKAPFPVSVMGLNVMEKDSDGHWLCGSFSGLFRWNRKDNTATDYFTGKVAPKKAGAPFGKKAISGISQHFISDRGKDITLVAEYHDGANRLVPQPEWMKTLPMSLWNVALELHTGRFFIGNIATYIFIFITGLAAIWCLWTGYAIRRRKKN